MTLALVGHGRMGRAVEELAGARGIDIADRFTRARPLRGDDRTRRVIGGAVLVDFSAADAVLDTVRAAAALECDVVIGTTGWGEQLEEIRAVVERAGIGVVYASNFSIGVNVVYRLAEQAAALLAGDDRYDPFIVDWHHRLKKDSPSGTALEIQRRMARHYGGRQVPITSQRAGYIPSMHAIVFDSDADTIHLEHRTRTRRGLAEGALLASRWIAGRPGFHEFSQVIESLWSRR